MPEQNFSEPIEIGTLDRKKIYVVGISDEAGFKDLLTVSAPESVSIEQIKSKKAILLSRLSKFSLGELSLDEGKIDQLLKNKSPSK